MNNPKKNSLNIWYGIVAVIPAVFPVIFLYCNNADTVALAEILAPLIVFSLVALVLLFILRFLLHNIYHATIISAIVVMVFSNYTIIETFFQRFLPKLYYWHIVSILVFVVFHIGYFIYKKMSKEACLDTIKVIAVVFTGLMLVNVSMAIPKVVAKLTMQTKPLSNQIPENVNIVSRDFPNIYYIIYDTYAGFETIRKCYGYDNVELEEYLTDKQFTISRDSHNESSLTATVLTNIMNLDYVVEDDTDDLVKTERRRNNVLFSLLRQNGYDVVDISDSGFYGLPPKLNMGRVSTKTAEGENLSEIAYKKTVFYPFFTKPDTYGLDIINQVINYFSDAANLPSSPTFNMCHFMFPHAPFIVDENGGALPVGHAQDWANKKYYLGQFKYATKTMVNLIDNLLKVDPNCIIVLQSDHSPIFLSQEDKTNILNAVYYRGESIAEIEGESAINTLRLLFNKLLDTKYEKVEMRIYAAG